MIEARDLSFSYGASPVFSNLSFSLAEGKVYGIIGPNGSGKTTLLRVLCGIAKPTCGEAFLDGIPYDSFDRLSLARQLSLMPQFSHLPPVTARDLVERGRYPYLGATRRMTPEDRAAVERALIQAGAIDLAHRPLNELSGGERQRVCLALLLAQDTPYVFLDEPTTYLDLSHRFGLLSQLRDLSREGRCVVAVLHDLPQALRWCDELLILHEGALISTTPSEFARSSLPDAVFGVACHPVILPDGREEYVFLPK